MVDARTLRTVLLGSLVGALSVAALTGIFVFILGDFGEVEMKILATTLSLTFFSVTALSCTAVLESRRADWLAVPGLGVSLLGLAWSLGVIWPEWDSEPMVKTMVILVLFAFSFGQACLLALPRLKDGLAWLLPAALACIFALATLLSVMIVFEWDDELLFRLAGVLGILDASATLAIPVLYKLAGQPPPEAGRPERVADVVHIELACPRCRHRGVYPVGTIDCPECSLRIRVEIIETPKPEEASQRRAGRFQFSLKAVLLAFLIVSLPLGWIGHRIGQLRRQAAVIEALAPLNPYVYYSFGNAHTVEISEADPSKFDAPLLARLRELPKLEYVRLTGVPMTEEDVDYLEGLEVEWLRLESTLLTPDAVERLEKAHPNWQISTSDSATEESAEYAVEGSRVESPIE